VVWVHRYKALIPATMKGTHNALRNHPIRLHRGNLPPHSNGTVGGSDLRRNDEALICPEGQLRKALPATLHLQPEEQLMDTDNDTDFCIIEDEEMYDYISDDRKCTPMMVRSSNPLIPHHRVGSIKATRLG
jgi:hypothetical protein